MKSFYLIVSWGIEEIQVSGRHLITFFIFLILFFRFIIKNWIINLCDTEQVNNAGIAGTIAADPDTLRSKVAASGVSFNVQFLCCF